MEVRTRCVATEAAYSASVTLNRNSNTQIAFNRIKPLVFWNMKCTQQLPIRFCVVARIWQGITGIYRAPGRESPKAGTSVFIREVCMELMMRQSVRAMADVMSGILNWVCPDCGGRMGGPGKEFKCQGKCQTDWRQVWDCVSSAGRRARSKRAMRPS
jgi:hypothetical protein